MIGQAPASHITGVPGWENAAEQELLYALAQQVPENGLILEIGGEFGMSASLFIKGARESVRIYTVDLFPGSLLSDHRANLREAGFADGRSEQIQGASASIVLGWHEPIDLLFIDGDHSYEAVLADLNNWTPFVKQGGIVVLHDVAVETNLIPHPLHHEVKRALDAWQREQTTSDWEFVRSVSSAVVLKRIYAPDPRINIDHSGVTFVAGSAIIEESSDNLDAEVHASVDPEVYDDLPSEPPKKRGRPKKA